MFCKYCGAQLESDALFCTSCGKRIDGAAAQNTERLEQEAAGGSTQQGQPQRPQDEQAQRPQPQGGGASSSEGEVWDKASLKKLNPICIAGIILTVLSLFFIYFGIVALAALIVSAVGFYSAKKKNQTGAALAVICMIVSGVLFLFWLIWMLY